MKNYEDLAGDGGSNIVAQVVAQREKLRNRLDRIKHKVSMMSGKGGVGKSSITANIAACLADRGHKVGILDADLNGPSMVHLLGVDNEVPLNIDEDGVEPGVGGPGIKIMSMDLLLPHSDSPVMWTDEKGANAAWSSTMESTALRELLMDTRWGKLDFLLIDMPPGSDRVDNVLELIPELEGVVEITLPSPVSQHIVAKSITKNTQLGVPIIGLVENMATYVCPHCDQEGKLFEGQEVRDLAGKKGIPFLGKIPFDTRIGRKVESGGLFYTRHKDTVTGRAIAAVADNLLGFIDKNSQK